LLVILNYTLISKYHHKTIKPYVYVPLFNIVLQLYYEEGY